MSTQKRRRQRHRMTFTPTSRANVASPPYIVIAASTLFTAALASTATSTIDLSAFLFFIIASTYLAVLTGATAGSLLGSDVCNRPLEWEQKADARLVAVSTLLGLLSFLLRLVDKFLLRGASFSLDFNATLSHLQDYGSTPLGLVTAPLLFMCMYPYLHAKKEAQFSLGFFALFWLPAVDGLLTGQRFVLLFSLFTFVSASLLTYSSREIVKRAPALLLAISTVIAIAFVVINLRYETRSQDVFHSLANSAYAELLLLPDFVKRSESTTLGLLYNLIFYLQHSLFEFQNALNITPLASSGGAFNFPIPFKLLGYLTHTDDPWNEFSKAGIYLSFFGAAWFDFGAGFMLIALIIGFLLSYFYKKYRRWGSSLSLFAFIYFSYVVIMFPVTTMLGYGHGNYVIFSIALLFIMKRVLRKFAA